MFESAAKYFTMQKPDKLIYPNEAPTETPKFPPEKRCANLEDFLYINYLDEGEECDDYFEDANFFYHLNYGAARAHLTIAFDKNLYYDPKKAYFNPGAMYFDARFIFGQGIAGSLQFGHFKDNNLGKIFYLTEPKDAEHMLLSMTELSGKIEWLKDSCGVCYFRHASNFALYAILPVGTRFDEEKQLAIVYQDKKFKDREFYQKLFEEHLKKFVGLPVKLTEFKVVVPPPTEEELAEKACREAAEQKRLEKLQQNIEQTSQLLHAELAGELDYFDLHFSLIRTKEFFKIGPREIIEFTLTPNSDHREIIYRSTFHGEEFQVATPEINASCLVKEVKTFLNDHREAFDVYKKIYQANKSYHDLIAPSSREPKLNYNHIFRNPL